MSNSEARHAAVLERLDRDSFVSVTRLAADLSCSEMTIRRDLAKLEVAGKLKRRHGGAVPTKVVRLEFAMRARSKVRAAQKTAIARRALQLIRPGQKIILDTGTTTLALAHAMRELEKVTVVTTSLANVWALMGAPGVECILLGGSVRETSPDLYGPLVEENLSRMRVDIAFIGCDALTDTGEMMTTDHRIAKATELMIANSKQTALLADSTKAGSTSFITYSRLSEIDYLVTDPEMPAEVLEMAGTAGVETLLAGPLDTPASK
jgi:DeoR family transcriptional regulator, fructose operon transcriptional repressor